MCLCMQKWLLTCEKSVLNFWISLSSKQLRMVWSSLISSTASSTAARVPISHWSMPWDKFNRQGKNPRILRGYLTSLWLQLNSFWDEQVIIQMLTSTSEQRTLSTIDSPTINIRIVSSTGSLLHRIPLPLPPGLHSSCNWW